MKMSLKCASVRFHLRYQLTIRFINHVLDFVGGLRYAL